jgi:hypothetical protein
MYTVHFQLRVEMFETHDSWQKNYFLAQDEGYKSWHCFRLKNTRPWFLVRFIYIEDTQIHDQLFFSDIERLKNFSEHPKIKILEVCVGSSPETNHTNSTQLSKLESIYSACNGSNRNQKFLLYELEGGKSFAYPAEYYDENLDDVNLIFTTLDHNPLDIPDR